MGTAPGLDGPLDSTMRASILPVKLTHLAGRNQVLHPGHSRCDNVAANKVWFNHLT